MSKYVSLMVGLFFVLSLASGAAAYKDAGTFGGNVVAIDKNAGTLTVKSSGPDSRISKPVEGGLSGYNKEEAYPPAYKTAGEFTFGIDDKTSVLLCDMSRNFTDISVGDKVSLSYREKDGKFIAESINISAPAAACNDLRRHTSKTSMIDTQYRAGQVIGMNVQNTQGENLGTIRDVTFNNRTGRVSYAVVGSGGVMGMDERYYAIPWKALSFNTGRSAFILDVDKDKLASAPSFSKDNWPDFTDQTWDMKVHRFYGLQPYWQEYPTQ